VPAEQRLLKPQLYTDAEEVVADAQPPASPSASVTSTGSQHTTQPSQALQCTASLPTYVQDAITRHSVVNRPTDYRPKTLAECGVHIKTKDDAPLQAGAPYTNDVQAKPCGDASGTLADVRVIIKGHLRCMALYVARTAAPCPCLTTVCNANPPLFAAVAQRSYIWT